jgi:hypothetical protein
LRLETNKIKEETYVDKGVMVYVLSYDGTVLGEGRVSMKELTAKVAIK